MIPELNRKIKALKSLDIDKIILNQVKKNSEVIAELISEDQLFEQGITGEGVNIAGYQPYTEVTVEIKKDKGQPYNRVTLRDEGDFHRSFYVKIVGDGFEVDATDWKTGDLIDKYGKEILWFTDENIQEIIDVYVRDVVANENRKALLS